MQSRKNFIRNISLSAMALSLADIKAIARFCNLQDYHIQMLTKNIGIFTEKGGTILFMLHPSGNVVVDAQFPDTAPNLIAEMQKLHAYPFNMLINTHHHADHTSGNIAFKGLVKNVVAHKNSRLNQQQVAAQNKAEDKQLYPDIVFEKSWQQTISGENIQLDYFGPGHTDGDAIVYFKKAGIVHVGDLVFNRRHPYIDKTAGASMQNWISILNIIDKKYPDKTVFVCGHAGDGYKVVINKGDIRAFKNYLQRAVDYTSAQIKLGKSKEQIIQATTVISGAEEWKGEGIERTLTAAYTELTVK